MYVAMWLGLIAFELWLLYGGHYGAFLVLAILICMFEVLTVRSE